MHNVMLSWQAAGELAGGLALVGLALRHSRHPSSRAPAAFAIEASLVSVLYMVWQFAAVRAHGDAISAVRRGQWIARFEHTLRLPSERSVQHLVIGHPLVVQAANLYYDTVHFAAVFLCLVWLWFRHHDRYRAVRNVLALTTLGCLVISFVPVAPPRMLVGYVDTAAAYGESVYGGQVADELSAMPSVHVAWAVFIGWYALRIGRSRWRLLGPLHAVITVFVVICTANHWWLDGIVGVTVLVICAWSVHGLERGWHALSAARHAPVAQQAAARQAPVARVPRQLDWRRRGSSQRPISQAVMPVRPHVGAALGDETLDDPRHRDAKLEGPTPSPSERSLST